MVHGLETMARLNAEAEKSRDVPVDLQFDLYRRGAIATIEARDATITSLQRELAEARAEIDSLKSRASLTPLTDESVRGVLVDDGEPRRRLNFGEQYFDAKDGTIGWCGESGDFLRPMQPVRLRPASEFGVNHIPDVKKMVSSTPAEPTQKLVPLPEGAVVYRPASIREGGVPLPFRHGEWINCDPALYGVPAERVRELEAEQVDCMACGRGLGYHGAICGECKSDELQLAHFVKEAERLRKAIETADVHYKGGFSLCHVMAQLRAALTPPTAASGEKPGPSAPSAEQRYWCPICKQPCDRSSCAKCFQRFDNLLPVLTSAPSAESEPRDEGTVDFMSAASEPEDGEDLEEPAESEGGDLKIDTFTYHSDALAVVKEHADDYEGLLLTTAVQFTANEGRTEVSDDDVDKAAAVLNGQLAHIIDLAKSVKMWIDRTQETIAERDALSARLAACEERCKELEAGLRFIGSDPGLSIASRFFYDQLLAPKAEGGRDGR